MASKAAIADVRQLHLKKYRTLRRLFLAEGVKSVHDLLLSDFRVEEVFATDDICREDRSWLQGTTVTRATLSEMARMSTMDTPPGILAVVRQPDDDGRRPFDDTLPVLALDRIADPGNLGAIIRTADWFDFTQIVCSPDCAELYSPKTVRATMGSFCRVRPRVSELAPFLHRQASIRQIAGTFLDGEPIQSVHFHDNAVIVVGSESHGISAEAAAAVTVRMTIPSAAGNRPHAESLNAAAAAAITMAAFRK